MRDPGEVAQEVATTANSSAWGATIDEKRKAELELMLRDWDAEPSGRPGPFADVSLTGADVFWLAARALVRADRSIDEAETMLRSAIYARAKTLSIAVPTLHLEKANLGNAHLERASLSKASLAGAHLYQAHLRSADLREAHLEGAILRWADLENALLEKAQLDGALLDGAKLQHANMPEIQAVGAYFSSADLRDAHLEQANLRAASLHNARLEGARLHRATLEGADLREASFDKASRLNEAKLDRARLDQVIFDNTDLRTIDWSLVRTVGDEEEAGKPRQTHPVTPHSTAIDHMKNYRVAARAYRSLANTLRSQGITTTAATFNSLAERMECKALWHELQGRRHFVLPRLVTKTKAPFGYRYWAWRQRLRFAFTVPWACGRWLSSVALYAMIWLSTRMVWLIGAYFATVIVFAGLYLAVSMQAHTGMSVPDAFFLSVTSFHGRGLQPASHLTDTMRALAAAEAPVGLLLEAIFVAAFVRRVMGN